MKYIKYDMLIIYYTINMSLDIFDKIKLIPFYYKCKILNLTDIVPLIIQYIIKTQCYVLETKYDMCSIPDIIIDGIHITAHTTHLLLKMLLQQYPEFNTYIQTQLSSFYISFIQTYPYLVIKNIIINNNIIILTLNIKKIICTRTPYDTRYYTDYVAINDYVLKL